MTLHSLFLLLGFIALLLAIFWPGVRRVTFVEKSGTVCSKLIVYGRIRLPSGQIVSRRPRNLLALANYAPAGTHRNGLTKFSDVNLPVRNLLMKAGSTDGRMTICGAHDYPIGFCPDETTGQAFLSGATTFSTYPVGLLLLGSCAEETRLGTAHGVVTAFTPAFLADNGQVQATPVAAGTYWQIGMFVTSGADGDDVEIDTCLPRQLVI